MIVFVQKSKQLTEFLVNDFCVFLDDKVEKRGTTYILFFFFEIYLLLFLFYVDSFIVFPTTNFP